MLSIHSTPAASRRTQPRLHTGAFTLVEMLLSITIMTILMLILTSMTEAVRKVWRDGQSRTEALQSARTSLELMARELTASVVDTRMQFVIAPGSVLTTAGAEHVAVNSPALLWMAPLGTEGDLRCVGYYLYRDADRKFYRLKRLFIAPLDAAKKASPYFPRMSNLTNPQDPTLQTSAINADWFTRNWDGKAFDEEDPANTATVVSTVADGVVALWVQGIDLLGNPIPLVSRDKDHPTSPLLFNSAAYFQTATTAPFEGGRSFAYLSQTPQTMKANRLPAAVEITMVTLDSRALDGGPVPPAQNDVYTTGGALDVEASVQRYQSDLRGLKINTARVFSTRTRLINGN